MYTHTPELRKTAHPKMATTAKSASSCGARATKVPMTTAIPLPPVNFRNTDQLFPAIAAASGTAMRRKEGLPVQIENVYAYPYRGAALCEKLEKSKGHDPWLTHIVKKVGATYIAAAILADVYALYLPLLYHHPPARQPAACDVKASQLHHSSLNMSTWLVLG